MIKTLSYFLYAFLVALIASFVSLEIPARPPAIPPDKLTFYFPVMFRSPPGLVSGVVLDQDGPVAGATVRAGSLDSSPAWRFLTPANRHP